MRLQTFGASVGLLGLMLLGSGVAQAPAQTSSKDQIPKFRAKSQLVMVPVVVTKGDNPVRGLTKDNFILEQDGHPRAVSIFEAVSTDTNRIAPPPKTNPKAFDNLTSDSAPRALTLIAIDSVNTPYINQANLRKDVLKFLARNMVPNQLVGLVVMEPKGVRILRDFTGDTASLISVLQAVTGQPNRYSLAPKTAQNTPESIVPPNMAGEPTVLDAAPVHFSTDAQATLMKSVNDFLKTEDQVQNQMLYDRMRETLESFLQIANGLSGYPGRKALLWASGSFPTPFDPSTFVRDMTMADLYERTLKSLADANVVVYPIDVKGLTGANPGADATVSKFDRAAGVTGGEAYRDAGRRIDTFRDFAESTGGRIYFDPTNNDKVFRDAAEDSQVYYMLGYYLDEVAKPGWHKLKVKLKDADGKVRTRSGFFVAEKSPDPESIRKTDLLIGSRSPFDYTSLRLAGQWLDIVPDGAKRKAQFELRILPGNNLIADRSNPQLDLDIVAVARKPDTLIAGQSGRTIHATLNPQSVEQIDKEGIKYKGVLDLEPGVYDVRFLVRDNQSGRMGSVLSTLEVK